jgi:hypothetical protein
MGINNLFFAGCGTKKPNLPIMISLRFRCARDLSAIYENLSVVGYPKAAIALFGAGHTLMVAGTLMVLHYFLTSRTAEVN